MSDTQVLAVREYSDRQLQQRIKLNQQAGYGLDKANPAQLNIVFLLCQRYDLDPVSDITLYEGRPFITIDGRLRLLRRHPDYRGYTCKPLGKDDKVAWGYEPDDVVVECIIRTAQWGEISARGKVTAAEVQQARDRARETGRRAAPIGVHPVEIAEKRAIARAERAAFGQDTVLDDETIDDAVRTVVEERNDSTKVALNAAKYDEIYDGAYDLKEEPKGGGEEQEVPQQEPRSAPAGDALATDIELLERNDQLSKDATSMGIRGIGHLRAKPGWPTEKIADANAELAERIEKTAAEQAKF